MTCRSLHFVTVLYVLTDAFVFHRQAAHLLEKRRQQKTAIPPPPPPSPLQPSSTNTAINNNTPTPSHSKSIAYIIMTDLLPLRWTGVRVLGWLELDCRSVDLLRMDCSFGGWMAWLVNLLNINLLSEWRGGCVSEWVDGFWMDGWVGEKVSWVSGWAMYYFTGLTGVSPFRTIDTSIAIDELIWVKNYAYWPAYFPFSRLMVGDWLIDWLMQG